jgi:hypothetical protein
MTTVRSSWSEEGWNHLMSELIPELIKLVVVHTKKIKIL